MKSMNNITIGTSGSLPAFILLFLFNSFMTIIHIPVLHSSGMNAHIDLSLLTKDRFLGEIGQMFTTRAFISFLEDVLHHVTFWLGSQSSSSSVQTFFFFTRSSFTSRQQSCECLENRKTARMINPAITIRVSGWFRKVAIRKLRFHLERSSFSP